MNGRNIAAGRVWAGLAGVALALTLAGALGFPGGTRAGAGPASGSARWQAQQRVPAPLKPDRVEALLNARATALGALLAAHDLVDQRSPTLSGSPAACTGVPGSAPLKPDWVEALLDARATALRSLLEAHDLEYTALCPDRCPHVLRRAGQCVGQGLLLAHRLALAPHRLK